MRLTEGTINGRIRTIRIALILSSLDWVDDGFQGIVKQASAIVGGSISLGVWDLVVGGAVLSNCSIQTENR